MKDIIVVAGLPGLGQDEWAEKQCESIGNDAVFLMEPFKYSEEWSKVRPEHQYVFLVDPHLCLLSPETIQGRLEVALGRSLEGVALRWVCTENDLEAALANTDKRYEKIIRKLSKDFKVPFSVQIIPTQGRRSPWWTIPVLRVFPKTEKTTKETA